MPTPTFAASDDDGATGTGRNVVAQTSTGNPDAIVMIGAHLDSVPEGPGIVDNGSGVASLLEIATRLGADPAVQNTVRFHRPLIIRAQSRRTGPEYPPDDQLVPPQFELKGLTYSSRRTGSTRAQLYPGGGHR